MLRIKLIKSTIGHNPRNRATVEALGLKRPHSVVEHDDTPTIRGMIRHVHPLISVEVIADTEAATKPKRAAKAAAPVKAKYEAAPRENAAPKKAAPAPKAKAPKADAAKPDEEKPKAKRTKKASEETK